MNEWPRESDATVAVEAAAKAAWEASTPASLIGIPLKWDELSPLDKSTIRNTVLPLVWAALSALPDPRYGAWNEGYHAGYEDGGFDEGGYGAYEYAVNPYPSGL